MPRYQWDSPYEWLMEYAAKLNATELFQEFSVIARELDSDKIQDLYQSDMAAQGYFEPIAKPEPDDEMERRTR